MGMNKIKILQPLIEQYTFYKQNDLSFDEDEVVEPPTERLSDDSADEADDEGESTQASPSTSTGVWFGEGAEFLLCTSPSDEDISSEDNLSQTAVKDKDSPPAVLTSSEEDAPEAASNEPRGEQAAVEAQSSAMEHHPASPVPLQIDADQPADDLASSSVQQDERQPPPPPPPSEASPEEEDSDATSFYSSSDDESGANHREVLRVVRNFTEPRNAILRTITSRNGERDVAGGSAFARFYTRRATPQERESLRIEDRNRMVYERFDESGITDRRVNEVVRRFENTGELPSTSTYLLTYMRRVRNVARAQELRWAHNMVEDEDSALHSHVEMQELLERVRESFDGAAED